MLSVVKIPLKGEVVGRTLNSHGNYIVDRGKSWKNHGIVFLNFYRNPEISFFLEKSLNFEFATFIMEKTWNFKKIIMESWQCCI